MKQVLDLPYVTVINDLSNSTMLPLANICVLFLAILNKVLNKNAHTAIAVV